MDKDSWSNEGMRDTHKRKVVAGVAQDSSVSRQHSPARERG